MTMLTTSRLILRPVQMSDVAIEQKIFPDWEVVKYLNAKVPWPFPDNGVEQYFTETLFPAIACGDHIAR